MFPSEVTALRLELLALLPTDADEIIALSDPVQKLARYAPSLTGECEFSHGMSMRRLVIIPRLSWNTREVRSAKTALENIKRLAATPGHSAALALACYGVRHAEYEQALAALEALKPQPVLPPADELPALPEAEPAPAPKAKRKPKAAPAPLETAEDDPELDEGTQAMLDDLRRQARASK